MLIFNVTFKNERDNGTSSTEKNQTYIPPCSLGYKVICVDDNFGKTVVLYRGENVVYKFIEVILKEYNYWKTVMNEHFNKDLIMSVENEKRFQSSN